jgi:hypothetical protein
VHYVFISCPWVTFGVVYEFRAVVALFAAPLDPLHLSVTKVDMIGWLAHTLRAGDTMAR